LGVSSACVEQAQTLSLYGIEQTSSNRIQQLADELAVTAGSVVKSV
jgi:hypothetical protein